MSFQNELVLIVSKGDNFFLYHYKLMDLNSLIFFKPLQWIIIFIDAPIVSLDQCVPVQVGPWVLLTQWSLLR